MTDDLRDPSLQPPEPSVLDYLRALLSFGRHPLPEIPISSASQSLAERPMAAADRELPRPRAGVLADIPWRSLLALGLAVCAQSLLEPPGSLKAAAVGIYVISAACLLWSAWLGEWSLAAVAADSSGADPMSYRRVPFLVAIPLAFLAFLALSGNLFTGLNVALWLGALGLLVWSLWLRVPDRPSLWKRMSSAIAQARWQIHIDPWVLLVLAAVLLVAFFRLYRLQQTPAEPFSDHAEKLLDVYDVSRGQTHIFFPRNTGREAIQMYWTLLVSWIFGTGFSFLSLKLGTALLGLITLGYVYALGKEVGGHRVALLSLLLTGIAYWPNVISRVGLRFPLYPLFVAPLMLHLIRGFRTRHRNQFILAGIYLGLGLHGYSPFRVVPLLVVVAFLLYMLHAQSRGTRQSALLWLVVVALVSLVVFLPLLRYATENIDSFSYRAMTRMAGVEQPLPAPWYQIFLSNTWNALGLFNWKDGGIWVHSVPDRPAMDVVSASLFLVGVVLLLVRYVHQRHWLDLFLLLSIPVLLLPSILSLAFPDENPSLNRTAGALVPAFLIAALALDSLITTMATRGRHALLAGAVAALLLWTSAVQNYDLVFRQYDREFRLHAWNSSEMGAVIRLFGQVFGETDTVWVVPFPHWVDTRLVGVWAGIPDRDFAMWTEQLTETLQFAGPKLFMARANTENPGLNDQAAVDALRQLYPEGSLSLHRSPVPGHDFWIYFVPALTTP